MKAKICEKKTINDRKEKFPRKKKERNAEEIDQIPLQYNFRIIP